MVCVAEVIPIDDAELRDPGADVGEAGVGSFVGIVAKPAGAVVLRGVPAQATVLPQQPNRPVQAHRLFRVILKDSNLLTAQPQPRPPQPLAPRE